LQTRGDPRRGELYLLDWSPGRGTEQAGRRPGLIVSNDVGNRTSGIVIVAALTTRGLHRSYPFHVRVPRSAMTGLDRDSVVMCEQLMTASKSRLQHRIGSLSPDLMRAVDEALRISLGLP
jgi:mRNA interferase MazF